MNIDKLAAEWLAAKLAEQNATAQRILIEEQILKVCPAKEEGASSTTLANGMKLTTTGKLNYKVNVDHMLNLCAGWDLKLRPVKIITQADETALKKIRAERQDLWAQIAPAVTITPAKTAVKIVEGGE
ncbi:MAG: hypothetical protein VW577_06565 [Pelagibacteraceae bacterium]